METNFDSVQSDNFSDDFENFLATIRNYGKSFDSKLTRAISPLGAEAYTVVPLRKNPCTNLRNMAEFYGIKSYLQNKSLLELADVSRKETKATIAYVMDGKNITDAASRLGQVSLDATAVNAVANLDGAAAIAAVYDYIRMNEIKKAIENKEVISSLPESVSRVIDAAIESGTLETFVNKTIVKTFQQVGKTEDFEFVSDELRKLIEVYNKQNPSNYTKTNLEDVVTHTCKVHLSGPKAEQLNHTIGIGPKPENPYKWKDFWKWWSGGHSDSINKTFDLRNHNLNQISYDCVLPKTGNYLKNFDSQLRFPDFLKLVEPELENLSAYNFKLNICHAETILAKFEINSTNCNNYKKLVTNLAKDLQDLSLDYQDSFDPLIKMDQLLLNYYEENGSIDRQSFLRKLSKVMSQNSLKIGIVTICTSSIIIFLVARRYPKLINNIKDRYSKIKNSKLFNNKLVNNKVTRKCWKTFRHPRSRALVNILKRAQV